VVWVTLFGSIGMPATYK